MTFDFLVRCCKQKRSKYKYIDNAFPHTLDVLKSIPIKLIVNTLMTSVRYLAITFKWLHPTNVEIDDIDTGRGSHRTQSGRVTTQFWRQQITLAVAR